MGILCSLFRKLKGMILGTCAKQPNQQSRSVDRHLRTKPRSGQVRKDSHRPDDAEHVFLDMTEGSIPPKEISLVQGSIAALTTKARKNIVHKPENGVSKQPALIQELNRKPQDKNLSLKALQVKLDLARRDKEETRRNSDKEEQRQKLIIKEKEKALNDANLRTSQWMTQCRKLEAQLGLIECESAQESLKSGAYSDDHANPGMLEVACKAVDKATEDLARFLYSVSVTKDLRLGSAELERFICHISPARPAEFSRAIQVKYVWSHWICSQMFRGFEHVFFDVDKGQFTSPLDSKKHAWESFQSFQQMKILSSCNSCPLFQEFWKCKYSNIFPQWLVNQSFFPNDIVFNEYGRFNGDGEICDHFTALARAIWSLHQLAFSFDPPASILRMAAGTPFNKQFQEPVIHVEDGDGMSQVVMLMVRPAFRVRKSVVRSRVFLCNNPNPNQLTLP